MENREVLLVLHDIRSAHNVGSMFRTADGAGVSEIILSGYSPCPHALRASVAGGPVPLYLSQTQKAIAKTALGAENSVPWRKVTSLTRLLNQLKKEGYEIVALEQSEKSVDYRKYRPQQSLALIVGNEVEGVAANILKRCDAILEIPMRGKKNSLNVSVATGIALYEILSTMK